MFSDPSNHSLGVVECTQGYEFHFHQVTMRITIKMRMMSMTVKMETMSSIDATRSKSLFECASIGNAAILH